MSHKILVIGDSGVGKTSLIQRFINDEFHTYVQGTIGIEFHMFKVNLNGKEYKMQIWDTAGQERYRAMTTGYYRNAHAVILVFDLNNAESFNHIRFWLGEISTKSNRDCTIFLVGNKADLLHKITRKQINQLVEKTTINQYHEVSANSSRGTDVKKLFNTVANLICINAESPKSNSPNSSLEISPSAKVELDSSKCC